jgi:hypothetical protein
MWSYRRASLIWLDVMVPLVMALTAIGSTARAA